MEETLEQLHARHRKEQRDLQSRITSKKKNATKKTRKGVNDECAELERLMRERQQEELRKLDGEAVPDTGDSDDDDTPGGTAPDGVVNGVADKLQSTTLTTNPADSPSVSPGSTPAEQPKKRNRQKERLARRAAEQEAAAAEAASEAANMTDKRGDERTVMQGEFRRRGLTEKEIQPDGHCLFSAVADQLAQIGVPLNSEEGELPYKTVRRAAAAYMLGHADDFAGFMEEPLESYAVRMRDTAEWGGQLELVALANAYGVEIRVLQDGSPEVIAPSGGAEGKGEIWLAYYRHGFGLGEHYNSLRKAAATAAK
jgi:OTU domain-containing protein 6